MLKEVPSFTAIRIYADIFRLIRVGCILVGTKLGAGKGINGEVAVDALTQHSVAGRKNRGTAGHST